jgi:acyl-CoA reductase-like NAD-dependent aldehyde dehydrogenase
MTHNSPQNQAPAYTFQGRSSSEEFLEVARIYDKEANQMLERAQEALAEDRQEEAKLLMHLATVHRERADEFKKAAREDGSDPIVAEILDHQQSNRKNYTSYTPVYSAPDEELPQSWIDEMKPPPLGPIARAVAWIGSWIAP